LPQLLVDLSRLTPDRDISTVKSVNNYFVPHEKELLRDN